MIPEPPKDPKENRLFRAWLRQQCENKRRREVVLDRCKHDLFFYVDSHVYQYNPAKTGHEVAPFILRPMQERVLKRTAGRLFPEESTGLRLDMIWEKSREEGASWMALFLFDHRCLFWNRQKFLCVSHTAMAVDNGTDPDSLFWKIRFMHEHLPEWITRDVEHLKQKFWYPGTKSAITGAASTGRSGVGGRATAVLLDELGKQESAREIVGQTADTGPRLMVSTHYGVGTEFYRQCVRSDVTKEIMHWSENPEKNKGLYRWDVEKNKPEVIDNTYQFTEAFEFVTDGKPTGGPFPGVRSPWYDVECVRRASDRDVAMHLDINPEGSSSQFFDAGMILRLQERVCRSPWWEGDLEYDRETGTPKGVRQCRGGPLRLWCHLDRDGRPPLDRYGMGWDIAGGTGATRSCMGCFSARTGEKIAEYANPFIEPTPLAVFAVALARMFRGTDDQGAKLGWECPGPGLPFGARVYALGYRNIHYHETEGKPYQFIQATGSMGWHNSPKGLLILLEDYRTALVSRECVNFSKSALSECLQFSYTPTGYVDHQNIKSSNDPSGARVMHGDQVIADALGWKMVKSLGAGRQPVEPPVERIPSGSLAWRHELHRQRELAMED